MKPSSLFPYAYKAPGWILLGLGLLAGLVYLIYEDSLSVFQITWLALISDLNWESNQFFTLVENNFLDEITSVLIILGGILVAFSQEKQEDEFIARIRLESLVWATYVNYAILLLAVLGIFDLPFFWVLVFNMFTMLLFFVIRFRWILHQSRSSLSHEE
jgi:hypothetical protein